MKKIVKPSRNKLELLVTIIDVIVRFVNVEKKIPLLLIAFIVTKWKKMTVSN